MASKISTNNKKTIIAEQKTCFIALNPFIFHLKTDLLYHRHVFSSRSLVLCRRGTMSCFPKHILPVLLPPASNRFRQTGRESDRPTDRFCRSAARSAPCGFVPLRQSRRNTVLRTPSYGVGSFSFHLQRSSPKSSLTERSTYLVRISAPAPCGRNRGPISPGRVRSATPFFQIAPTDVQHCTWLGF
jgi:hypothetical protein